MRFWLRIRTWLRLRMRDRPRRQVGRWRGTVDWSNWLRWQRNRSWKSESWSEWCSCQWVREAMVLVEILIFQGHISVIHRYGQLTLPKEPLFSQVVIDLVTRLDQMIWFAIFINVISISDQVGSKQISNTLARIPHALTTQYRCE